MTFFQPLLEHTPLFLGFVTVLGLLIGSFLNVVIHRTPIIMEREWREQCREILANETQAETEPRNKDQPFNLVVPRSRCPHCGHPITALENIPVISYLVLRGRCSECHSPISMRYPGVELLTGLLSLVVAWQLGPGWQTAAALLLTWGLVALSFIDFDTQLLPDNITLPFLWLGLLINLGGLFATSQDSLIGAMAGYGLLWAVFQGFRLLTGKEGMGYGDFKLLAMLGAWLGWQALPVVVLLSSLVGAVIGISLITLRGHDRNNPIPFGPYLAIAGWIALLWGEDLMQAYLAWNGVA